MPTEARELVLPHPELGGRQHAAQGKDVDDVALALLGRAKVETRRATVHEVGVALAQRAREGDQAEAAERVQVRQVGEGLREHEDGRLVAAGGLGQTVLDPPGGLHGERVERRREAGGGEQHAGGGERRAPHRLDLRIQLRRVGRREAQGNLAVSEKLPKVLADERRAIIAVDDERLDRHRRLHLGSDVRQDERERLGRNVPRHRVRSHDATIERASVDRATIGS